MLLTLRTALRGFVAPLAGALLFSVTLSACDAASPTTTTSNTSASTVSLDFSGEALFVGLYFGLGEAATLFPEIWEQPLDARLTQNEQEAVDTYRDLLSQAESAMQLIDATMTLTRSISADDPSFFPRFGLEIRSGNPLIVQHALGEGADRLQTAAEVVTGGQTVLDAEARTILATAGLGGPTSRQEAIISIAILAIAVAVVVVAAVLIAVTVEVTFASPPPGSSDDPNASRLRVELLASQIANRLQN